MTTEEELDTGPPSPSGLELLGGLTLGIGIAAIPAGIAFGVNKIREAREEVRAAQEAMEMAAEKRAEREGRGPTRYEYEAAKARVPREMWKYSHYFHDVARWHDVQVRVDPELVREIERDERMESIEKMLNELTSSTVVGSEPTDAYAD